MEPYKPFLEADSGEYWRTWDVNVHGLINMARSFLPAQSSARASDNAVRTMINVASSGALGVRVGDMQAIYGT
jgi:NAD(P)-dependent dehydrogenase (short-subunit alcohol dehydrogenase family)